MSYMARVDASLFCDKKCKVTATSPVCSLNTAACLAEVGSIWGPECAVLPCSPCRLPRGECTGTDFLGCVPALWDVFTPSRLHVLFLWNQRSNHIFLLGRIYALENPDSPNMCCRPTGDCKYGLYWGGNFGHVHTSYSL